MTYKMLLGRLGLAAFLASLPSSARADDAHSLVVKGSTTIAPIMRKMAGKFARANRISVNVQGGGSSAGIACAKAGTCDVGMASKSVTGADAAGLKVTHFGWDGLAFIVNQAIPVQGLSKAQLFDVFTGKISNWQDLGGPNLPILVIARDSRTGEADFFKHVFKEEARGSEMIKASDEVLVKVAQNPGAISFMSFGLASKNLQRGLKIIDVDTVKVDVDSLHSGKYPFRRELVLLTKANASDDRINLLVQDLLARRPDNFEAYGFLTD